MHQVQHWNCTISHRSITSHLGFKPLEQWLPSLLPHVSFPTSTCCTEPGSLPCFPCTNRSGPVQYWTSLFLACKPRCNRALFLHPAFSAGSSRQAIGVSMGSVYIPFSPNTRNVLLSFSSSQQKTNQAYDRCSKWTRPLYPTGFWAQGN